MNLRRLANSAIQRVNKNRFIVLKRNTGQYITQEDGTDVPVFETLEIKAQIQATSSDTLSQLDGLNIQGIHKEVWMYPMASGVVRVSQNGGDILIFPMEGETTPRQWKVTSVLEQWDRWCHVLVTLQTEEINDETGDTTEPE